MPEKRKTSTACWSTCGGQPQPLHFVAFVLLGNVVLDAVAYGLTALGFAAAGVAYARQQPLPA